MISCTEFIPAYSELFTYLEHIGGREAVIDYWEYIAQNAIQELDKCVRAEGLKGCYTYWSKSLNEEAADFTMTLDEEKKEFIIDMHHCPSKGRLLEFKQMVPYHDYCGHCGLIYRRVLEKLGYTYDYNMDGVDHAACCLTITGPWEDGEKI